LGRLRCRHRYSKKLIGKEKGIRWALLTAIELLLGPLLESFGVVVNLRPSRGSRGGARECDIKEREGAHAFTEGGRFIKPTMPMCLWSLN